MVYGRDGSEIELHVLDMQNRVYKNALLEIINCSKEPKVVEIVTKAQKRIEELAERIDNKEF